MENKLLLLINPSGGNRAQMGSGKNFLYIPPLNLAYVAALTPEHWDIKIIDEAVENLKDKRADLVGITSYTHNSPRAYEIARDFRQNGIPVIMGGIHASMRSEEASRYADSIVIGDALDTWPQLIEDFEKGNLKSIYQSSRPSLENMPIPRRDLLKRRKGLSSFETVLTAVGCPFDCNFCSVTKFYGNQYRTRPTEDVLNELETLCQNGTRQIFFVDDNFVGYGSKAEERAANLLQGIIDRKLPIHWGGQASINFAKNKKLLNLAEKTGCVNLFVGFESLDPNVLKEMGKSPNLKAGDYRESIKAFHDHGISVAGGFIFGNDGDTKDVFNITRDFILSAGVDVAQYAPITPLPGTNFFKQMQQEGRILSQNYPEDWKQYDFTNVLVKPKNMSKEELECGLARIGNETCSSWPIVKRAAKTLINTKSPRATLNSFMWNNAFSKMRIK